MTVGTKRMVKRNVVVRKLDSLEALCGITTISRTIPTFYRHLLRQDRKGTYSVVTSDNPLDPTRGELSYAQAAPAEVFNERGPDEKNMTPSNYEDLHRGNNDLGHFLNIVSLANLAHVHQSENEWKAHGNPTETAIQVFASRFPLQ
ncbi:hypothetical protein HYALB_00007853 [Hymenoscyphus albidus]|uniref:Uncharacterized protein n=1 Tax=Hymenoscyphus albidus TaxID=595503 RepID=A0A9N9Q4A2_9HELO|nr:hypothetical protein HYALB_00007853 [Hymenoscyphus albidus]